MPAYGVDLGTTYSCIARVDGTDHAVVLNNAVGEQTTPSVVYFESPQNVVVGRIARNSAMLHPELVASLAKRDIGDPDVHWYYHGERHTPESISALILRELTRAAAEQTGEQVREVVVTVPAYFGLAEREATQRAARMAGLEVLAILPEPVAAALHYRALNASAATRHVLVYDLGGGTFDTTVIRLSGDDVEVVCTDGDHQLGGADWDARVMDYLLNEFAAEQPGIDSVADDEGMQYLAASVERLRKDLSEVESRPVTVIFDSKAVTIELSRTRLEELTRVLLDRTMDITRRTVAMASERGVTRLDDVLLVGGMTRMPAVKAGLSELLGLTPRLFEPDLAVAKGAAVFAAFRQVKVHMSAGTSRDAGREHDTPREAMVDQGQTLAERSREAAQVSEQLGMPVQDVMRLDAMTVSTVVPRAFGIKVIDRGDPLFQTDPDRARRQIVHLLAANTKLPADSGPQVFVTAFEDQPTVTVEVWEQAGSTASPELEHNVLIGEGKLTGLPPGRAGRPFEVTFAMTATGLLRVHAIERESSTEVRFEIRIGRLTEEQVEAARDVVTRYAVGG